MAGGRSYLFQPPRRAVGPSGINPSFLGLSRYQGWVTHVLLTRSPLSPDPKVWFSLDLHVLSAPPAFVLSQDQTLREDGCRHMVPPAILSLRASYLLKGRFHHGQRSGPEGSDQEHSFRDEVETLSLRAGQSLLRDRGSRHRRTFAVEFSKTSAVSVRRRKKSLRLAPEASEVANRSLYESVPGGSYCRVTRFSYARPFGRPRKYSGLT